MILPARPVLARGHYDLALYSLAIRNVANYSPPVVELAAGDELPEWEILLRLAGDRRRAGRATPTSTRSTTSSSPTLVQKAVDARAARNVEGRDADELLEALASTRRGPERVLDLMLRTGPYGDGFGADPDGLSLAVLEANPHGIDLGPLQPRIPEVLRTPTRQDRARARGDRRRRRARLRAVARPRTRERRAACSSAGATCARTTRGCTTSTCW